MEDRSDRVLSFVYCDFAPIERNAEPCIRFVVSVFFPNDREPESFKRCFDFVSRPIKHESLNVERLHGFDLKLPPNERSPWSTIALIAMAPIVNDRGKRCWRNLGTSVVSKKTHDESAAAAYHVVYNNGCGTVSENRVSGVFQIRTFESNPSYENRMPFFFDARLSKKKRERVEKPKIVSRTSKDDLYFVSLKKGLDRSVVKNDVPLLSQLNATFAPSDFYWRHVENKVGVALNDCTAKEKGSGVVLFENPFEPQSSSFDLYKIYANARKKDGGARRDVFTLQQIKRLAIETISNHPKERMRLPLFSVVYRKTPKIHVSFWINALTLLASYYHRTGDVSSFCDDFNNRFESGRRCAYASHLLTLFVQHLEYISDYDIVVVENDETEKKKTTRKLIEQFSSAFVNMCADCEDSNTAIYQTWKAFRKADFSTVNAADEVDEKLNKIMGVLRECQRLLTTHYIAFVCADIISTRNKPFDREHHRSFCEGYEPYVGARSAKAYQAYVSKDYVEASKKNYERKDCEKKYDMDDPDIVKETMLTADSAHICVKLIPKSLIKKSLLKNTDRVSKNILKRHFAGDDGANETRLPVLFLEATSFLFPSDEEPSKCNVRVSSTKSGETYEMNVQSLFTKGHPLLTDCLRIPYVFEKGFSNFYKGTAFFVTDAYKKSNLYTFSVSNGDGAAPSSLYKGISHGQLAYKTDRMIVTPYAAVFDDNNDDDDDRESTPLFETACRLQRRVDYEKNITTTTIVAKESENNRYNHLMHDSLFDERAQSKKISAFVDKCHSLTVKDSASSKRERLKDAETKEEKEYLEKWCDFNAFIDPKYVEKNDDVLDALYDALEKILASSSSSAGERHARTDVFDVNVFVDDFYVEHRFDRISNDLGAWCIFFHFKKSV